MPRSWQGYHNVRPTTVGWHPARQGATGAQGEQAWPPTAGHSLKPEKTGFLVGGTRLSCQLFLV